MSKDIPLLSFDLHGAFTLHDNELLRHVAGGLPAGDGPVPNVRCAPYQPGDNLMCTGNEICGTNPCGSGGVGPVSYDTTRVMNWLNFVMCYGHQPDPLLGGGGSHGMINYPC